MRDIASLYGDPAPSLMSLSQTTSREPEGLDPRDDYYSSALDPDGFRVDERPEPIVEQLDPEEEHEEQQQHKSQFDDRRDDGTFCSGDGSKALDAPMDLAKLVGVPPPPPPNAPPSKKGKRVVVKIMPTAATTTPSNYQGGGVKNVSSFKENEGENSSFDKEDAVENNNIKVAVPPSPAESSTATNSTRSSISSNGPLKDRKSMPRASASMRKARTIMNERRQLAVSTYESPHLVLEDEVKSSSEERLSLLLPKDPMTVSPREMPLSPTVRTGHTRSLHSTVAPLDSPSSAATKTHSNQTTAMAKDSAVPAVAVVRPQIPPSPVLSKAEEKKIDICPAKSPKPGNSLEKRSQGVHFTSQTQQQPAEEPKKQKKRGFIGKLFKKRRGKDRTPSAQVNSAPEAAVAVKYGQKEQNWQHSPDSPPKPTPTPLENVSAILENMVPLVVEDASGPELTAVLPKATPSLKPSLKSVKQRHYQGSTIEVMVHSPVEETSDADEVVGLLQNAVILPSSSVVSEGSAVKLQAAFSQDPPDDEHGDPPMQTGPPLLSPTNRNLQIDATLDEEEQSRIESVRSRIAEVYEEHLHPHENMDRRINDGFLVSISNKQKDWSEPHDEVSLLTGPSFESLHKKKSFDPSPRNVDGGGSAFGNDDRAPALRVEIQEHTMEPTGASPAVLDSTRVDDEPRRPVFGDPVGGSPASFKEVRAPSNDPLGMSPRHNLEVSKSPSERAMKLLNHEDRVEIMQLEGDVGDPPLVDGYLSDDSSVDAAKDDTLVLSEEGDTAKDVYEVTGNMSDDEKTLPQSNDKESAELNDETTQPTMVDVPVVSMAIAKTQKEAQDTPSAPHSTKSGATKGSKAANPSSMKVKQKVDANISLKKSCAEATSENDIEKAGFKSASNTPTATKEPLTISAAAFTNAKAVAYFHQLHGEPSPRHSWHVSKSKKSNADASSPKKPFILKQMKNFNSKKKKGSTSSFLPKKAPSPDEYCATNVDFYGLRLDETDVPDDLDETTPKSSAHSKKLQNAGDSTVKRKYVNNGLGSRFQGRRPSKKSVPRPLTPRHEQNSQNTWLDKDVPVPREESLSLIVPLGRITGMAVSRGVELRRIKREKAIASGLSERVILTPRQKPTGGNRFKMIRSSEQEIKDPIKRAGRRLLSKAAVPIQAAARRYLAKQEALDRMWAIIQVQSYIRRWRCETNFQAHIHSAVLIQKTARGWLAREQVQDIQLSATVIQKIVRGYLAAIQVYDAIYYVCRLQALARSYLVRLDIARQKEAAEVLQAFYAKIQEKKCEAATHIQRVYRGYKIFKALNGHPHVVGVQTLFRGFKARKQYAASRSSACVIQKYWRSFAACMVFQMQVADIITVQSVVRRWSALREVELVRFSAHSEAVVHIQSVWRSHVVKTRYQRHIAARKIQSTWRGFQAYTDYIFLIVDVLVVQRKVRQWLAVKKTAVLRRERAAVVVQTNCRRHQAQRILRQERAAVVVQTNWRRHQAQQNLLYSLVHIITVQSIARRFLSKSIVSQKQQEAAKRLAIRQKEDNAATSIQKAWRGFWGYSHFVIVRYEITRVQALVRRRLANRQSNLRLGCVILLQATGRRFLARKVVIDMTIKDAMIAAKGQELRERNAAIRIQFWWRIVMDWTKEKKAALKIERFFIFVKAEVDREIRKREIKRLAKEKKRKERRRQSEDNILEKAWLNTVDENLGVSSSSSSSNTPRSKSPPNRSNNKANTPTNKGVNPKLHLGGFNEPMTSFQDPPSTIQHAPSQEFSIVSNITNPSVFHKMTKHQLKPSQTETTEELDFDLTKSFHKEVRPRSSKSEKKLRLSTEDYIRKYGSGLKTAPNRLSQTESSEHFFTDHNGMTRQSSGTPTTYTQSHTQVSTPGSNAGTRVSSTKRRSSSGTPISISVGTANTPRGPLDASPRVPSTPRSTTNSRCGSTPRGFSSSGSVSRRRESSSPRFLPPVTPTSRHKHQQQQHISRRATSETESQTTTSETYYSRSSPRRHSGGIHGRGGNNPVMIMKTYPELEDGQSIQEAHEVLLLGDDYGEV